MTQAGFALLLANARYWTGVAPIVRRELARWEGRAQTISDSALREMAATKLSEERFNVEAAATLATLSSPPHRRHVVEAIVALQVAYDYLDLLDERQCGCPSNGGTRPLDTLADAFRPDRHFDAEHEEDPPTDGDSYVRELLNTTTRALARLPAGDTVATVALDGAMRCAKAQSLCHAAVRDGTAEVQSWAMRESRETGLDWQEYLAGASASVLSLHALMAAAADHRITSRHAREIDAAYLSICALTMLDSLVDRERDLATGELSYVDLYGDVGEMIARLALLTRHTAARARALPHGPHHVLTLVGIVAYYTSALTPEGTFPPSLTRPVRDELQPLMFPTLAVMRVWRFAKRVRVFRRAEPHSATRASEISDVSST
jgi:tetraprenyl-beta-curcumene synthase